MPFVYFNIHFVQMVLAAVTTDRVLQMYVRSRYYTQVQIVMYCTYICMYIYNILDTYICTIQV